MNKKILIVVLILLVITVSAVFTFVSGAKSDIMEEPNTYPVKTGEIITNFNSGKRMVKLNIVVNTYNKDLQEQLEDKNYLIRDIAIKEIGNWQVKNKEEIDVEEFKEFLMEEIPSQIGFQKTLLEGIYIPEYIVVV